VWDLVYDMLAKGLLCNSTHHAARFTTTAVNKNPAVAIQLQIRELCRNEGIDHTYKNEFK